METYGTLILYLILNSTVNKHHIRRVALFKAHGSKEECGQQFHEFFEANPEIKSERRLEFVWRVRDEHMSHDEVSKFIRPTKIARAV